MDRAATGPLTPKTFLENINTRHRIAEECGHDIMKIIELAEKAAKELGRRENAA